MRRYGGYGYDRDSSLMPILFAIIVVILLVSIPAVIKASNIEERQITVCAKERVATSDGGEYRIYAVEGTFTVEDSFLAGVRFDSADFYAKINTPATYDVRIKGYRIGLMSWFPNILEATEIDSSDALATCEDAGLRVDS